MKEKPSILMPRTPAGPSARRLLWWLLLAIALPTLVVFLLAVSALFNAYRAELEREQNHLNFLAALRARELDSLPNRVGDVLDEERPVLRLPLEPPPLPGHRPLIQRFFVLDGHNRPLLPAVPYLPGSTSPADTPYLVQLSSIEAFSSPDQGRDLVTDPTEIDRWIEQLQVLEARIDHNESTADSVKRLRDLADRLPECFFCYWVLYRWAVAAGSLPDPPTVAIDRTYDRIVRGRFRELVPDQPLHLQAALRRAERLQEKTGDPAALFDVLKQLYTNPLRLEISRKAFFRLRDTIQDRLARPGTPPLPEPLLLLQNEVRERLHLIETVLPGLERPRNAMLFAAATRYDGSRIYLAYRRARATFVGSEYVEGGILDFSSPSAPLAQQTWLSGHRAVQFAVLDADNHRLTGPELPADTPLRAAVVAGPSNLFKVVAFYPDPDQVRSELRKNLVLLLLVISVLALGAAASGLFAYRSLRRELELTRLKTEFVAGVSHELRTPLTTIQMFGEMLELHRVKDEAQAQRYFVAINQEAARLRVLIEDLLDFGRMEAGRVALSPAPVDPEDVARDVLTLFRRTPEGGRHRVRFTNRSSAPMTARLDRHAVERALLNLLVNAAKYSPVDATIQLGLDHNPDAVVFTVEDRGIGIPRRYHRRIFEKFFRVPDHASTAAGGTGLGLALVHQIVTAHGGKISVESAPGRGSRFTVVFPRSPDPRATQGSED
jgi:signal transduction histidine kinase